MRPDFKTYNKAAVIKALCSWHKTDTWTMERKLESSNKPVPQWSSDTTRVPRPFTNGAETTGCPRGKGISWTLTLQIIQKLTQNDRQGPGTLCCRAYTWTKPS